MSMRDIGADDFPESTLAGFLLHVAAELFDGVHKGVVVFVGEVVDFVDLVFRYDEDVAFSFGVDIEEGEGFIVFVDFVRGDFAVDDFSEDARHF